MIMRVVANKLHISDCAKNSSTKNIENLMLFSSKCILQTNRRATEGLNIEQEQLFHSYKNEIELV